MSVDECNRDLTSTDELARVSESLLVQRRRQDRPPARNCLSRSLSPFPMLSQADDWRLEAKSMSDIAKLRQSRRFPPGGVSDTFRLAIRELIGSVTLTRFTWSISSCELLPDLVPRLSWRIPPFWPEVQCDPSIDVRN